RRGFQAEEANLVLEIVAHVDAAMVVAQAEAGCATSGEASERLLNTLAYRLQGFEPGRFLDSMDARAFRRAVVDGGKDRHRTVRLRGGCGRIGPPHLVGCLGNDGSFVRIAAHRLWLPRRREQLMLPEQSQHAVLACADA